MAPWALLPQVRFAACCAARAFMLGAGEKTREQFYPALLPHLCFNRYDVAEGVAAYSRDTWRLVVGDQGRAWVARCLPQVGGVGQMVPCAALLLTGTVLLPCLALLRAACSCACGSLPVWGSRTLSWTVLTSLGQRLMLMMMLSRTQTHQAWRLDRCNHTSLTWFLGSVGPWSPTACGHLGFRPQAAVEGLLLCSRGCRCMPLVLAACSWLLAGMHACMHAWWNKLRTVFTDRLGWTPLLATARGYQQCFANCCCKRV